MYCENAEQGRLPPLEVIDRLASGQAATLPCPNSAATTTRRSPCSCGRRSRSPDHRPARRRHSTYRWIDPLASGRAATLPRPNSATTTARLSPRVSIVEQHAVATLRMDEDHVSPVVGCGQYPLLAPVQPVAATPLLRNTLPPLVTRQLKTNTIGARRRER